MSGVYVFQHNLFTSLVDAADCIFPPPDNNIKYYTKLLAPSAQGDPGFCAIKGHNKKEGESVIQESMKLDCYKAIYLVKWNWGWYICFTVNNDMWWRSSMGWNCDASSVAPIPAHSGPLMYVNKDMMVWAKVQICHPVLVHFSSFFYGLYSLSDKTSYQVLRLQNWVLKVLYYSQPSSGASKTSIQF